MSSLLKIIICLLIIMQFFTFCKSSVASNNKVKIIYPDDLVILIEDDPIVNDSIQFSIKNNSNFNSYCFPLEYNVTDLKDKNGYLEWNFFYPEFIFNKENEKENNNPFIGGSIDHYWDVKGHKEKIKNYLNTFTFEKIIKVKPNEVIKFKIPSSPSYTRIFRNPKVYLLDEGTYYFGIQINPNGRGWLDDLRKSTVDSLQLKGYKLYINQINSNKVPIQVSNGKLSK